MRSLICRSLVAATPLLAVAVAPAQNDWRVAAGELLDSQGVIAPGPIGGHLILFGGYVRIDPQTFAASDRTMLWNGDAWTELQPAVRPPARISAMLAYDAARQVTVLHGGTDGSTLFDDTWEWDGVQWTQVATNQAPSPRDFATMAFDGTRIVLFGGQAGSAVLGDTWTFDGVDWTQASPAVSPEARAGHAMAGGPGEVLLFGGSTSSSQENDTWRWDGSGWTELAPASSAPWRIQAGMVYSTQLGAYVLQGGLAPLFDGATWLFDGGQWTQAATDRSPAGVSFRTIGYHAPTGRVVAMHPVGPPNPSFTAVTLEFGNQLAYTRGVGGGCAAGNGAIWLRRVSGQPRPGETFELRIDDVSGIGLFSLGFSDTVTANGATLPVPLSVIGGPSFCFLRHSAEIVQGVPAGPNPVVGVAVPNLTSLVGLEFHVQGFDWAGPTAQQLRTTQMLSCGIDWN